jgi:uncharacterized membrane protein
MLAHYNNIQPDFANRIMVMAEKEQERTINLEKKNALFGYLITSLGLLLAFCVVGGLIYALVTAIMTGDQMASKWIPISMASVGGIFIYKRLVKK